MNNNQIELLSELAKKIQSKPKKRSEVIVSLVKAKILTKSGNFTNHYAHLKKVITSIK